MRLAALAALAGSESDATGAWSSAGRDAIDRAIADASGEDDWPEVRRRAAVALGARCQRPVPAQALADALDHDPDVGVRGDALSALVQCRAPGTAERLARIWDNAKLPIELRSRAVLEAVPLGDARLAAALVGKFTRWRAEAVQNAAALQLAQSAAAAIGRLAPPGGAAALGLAALGPACPPAARARLAELARSDSQAAAAARRAAAQCGK